MQSKTILSVFFVLMILVQWFVPSKMILDREDTLRNGEEYLFKCQPIDPNDPFRGKYITLRFSESNTSIPDSAFYENNQNIYLDFEKDEEGFATIASIKSENSSDIENSLLVNVDLISGDIGASNRLLYVDYPFTRFYMEESKAQPAEDLYRKIVRDTSQTTYAVVMIKDGVGVIKDVMINGVPIGTIVENNIRLNKY